ncbi:hypothetical protein ACFSC4_13400 [Deinococcus malanensis]|uniref:hypothetical protein n=1 Tax=Deinococcus malanensis TaxID=1706855 RepID=UPI0036343A97
MLHKPQARLIAGLVLATCALGTVTGLASLKLDQAFEHSAHITRDTTHRIEITLRLQKLLQRAVIPVHHYHIEGSSVQREHFALLASQIGDTLAEAQEPHDGAHPEEFAEIAASWQTIRSQVTAILAMPDPNAGACAPSTNAFMGWTFRFGPCPTRWVCCMTPTGPAREANWPAPPAGTAR